jgi:hypothetical protein
VRPETDHAHSARKARRRWSRNCREAKVGVKEPAGGERRGERSGSGPGVGEDSPARPDARFPGRSCLRLQVPGVHPGCRESRGNSRQYPARHPAFPRTTHIASPVPIGAPRPFRPKSFCSHRLRRSAAMSPTEGLGNCGYQAGYAGFQPGRTVR